MAGRITRLTFLTALLVILVTGPILAQGWGGPQKPRDNQGPGGGPGMRPGMGPGQGPEMGPDGQRNFPRNPEEAKKRREQQEKLRALRTTAEAHKNLADLYAQQNKIDEAVAELKKILALANNVPVDEDTPDLKIAKQLSHVYMEIAELYMKADRSKDAEAILNEGVEKLQKSDAEGASRMMLHMGNLYRKQGKVEEAERAFKKVIELNAATPK